jgi:hypothetical protein
MRDAAGIRAGTTADTKANGSASPLSASETKTSTPAKGRPATTPASGPIQMKQSKALFIKVQNSLRTDQPETIIRYWICGRDMKTNKAVILDGDEQIWKPGPAGTKECVKEFVSEVVSSDYQQKSAFVNTVRPGMFGMVRPGMPMVPQAGRVGVYPGMAMPAPPPQTSGGVKILGHAVQLIQNGKIIPDGESYIDPILKELVGSKGNTPGPKFEKTAESK